MSLKTITTTLAAYRDAATVADDAAQSARESLSAVLVAFGSTSISDAKVSAALDTADANVIGGKSPQKVRNVKRIGQQVKAGRIVVDTYAKADLAKVSGKAHNAKAWDAYFAEMETGATVTLSALAQAEEIESAKQKQESSWDLDKALDSLIAKADKEGVSRAALVERLRDKATPVLVAVPGEAA